MNFDAAIKAARERSAQMDEVDRRNGLATPSEAPETIVATAMAALQAAISLGNWDVVADAYVLLEQKQKVER